MAKNSKDKKVNILSEHINKNVNQQFLDVQEIAEIWKERWSKVYDTVFNIEVKRFIAFPYGIKVCVSFWTAIGQRDWEQIIMEEDLGWRMENKAKSAAFAVFESLNEDIQEDIIRIGLGKKV